MPELVLSITAVRIYNLKMISNVGFVLHCKIDLQYAFCNFPFAMSEF